MDGIAPMATLGKIFIGHGHSQVWRELKDFLKDDLELDCDEFNREPTAGMFTVERIEQMLEEASFAFLVMTGEDVHSDRTTHARENVIYEAGLFQAKLGFRKAIILLEDDCEQFSNIQGLIYIGFPQGRIRAVFHEVRKVLEREGIISLKPPSSLPPEIRKEPIKLKPPSSLPPEIRKELIKLKPPRRQGPPEE